MKVEKVLTIDGNIVQKEFQKGSISVYSYRSDRCDIEITLYFVNTQTEEVMFKQELSADCSQNTGFISRMNFTGC